MFEITVILLSDMDSIEDALRATSIEFAVKCVANRFENLER
jgi:hypothetical protein